MYLLSELESKYEISVGSNLRFVKSYHKFNQIVFLIKDNIITGYFNYENKIYLDMINNRYSIR